LRSLCIALSLMTTKRWRGVDQALVMARPGQAGERL
jgi:hypothetical protein